MARTLDAETIFDTLEVKLEGNVYTFRELTRTVSRKLTAAQARARETQLNPDTSDDDAALSLIRILDVLLAPAGADPKDGNVPNGGDDDELGELGQLLKRRWEADQLGADWLAAFTQTLQEEADARRRPTSTRTSSA